MRGTLTLIQSKFPAAFKLPSSVAFTEKPKIGQSFQFATVLEGMCHTSTVKTTAIDSETGELLLQTRNSIYLLKIEE